MFITALVCAIGLVVVEPPVLRPVDSKWREELGMPPPRGPKVILAEIDALPQPDTSLPGTNEGWSELRRKNNELAARRVGLISELEESGYAGERLLPLLQDKLRQVASPSSAT